MTHEVYFALRTSDVSIFEGEFAVRFACESVGYRT